MTINSDRIIRTLCRFTERVTSNTTRDLDEDRKILESEGFNVQTLRVCPNGISLKDAADLDLDPSVFIGAGTITPKEAGTGLKHFLEAENVSFNIEPAGSVEIEDVDILFNIIKERPEKTFNFAYTFNNVQSSPFFPSADFTKPGLSIGLQPTDLAYECSTIDEWFSKMERAWETIFKLLNQRDLLGVDSSIAPLYSGKSSLINFIKKVSGPFSDAVTSDIFLKISEFIRERNPAPAGLCGIMFPCLEDFELADEYEAGNFSIERNIFLSLHSGLGIDTYPIAVDESPERVLQVLRLLKGLSDKYRKPLAARFVCDGSSRVGERTVFNNKYLKDVILRKL
ncbi:MAG: DUF711 family protein [Acidobacteriota bacterium]